MRPLRSACVAAALSSCLFLGVSGAWAGTIASITSLSLPGSSTGTIGPIGSTPAPNNDNVVAVNPNTVPYSVSFNAPGPVQVEFAVANSGGTSEYQFTQTFINNTGQEWLGFVFELGYGLGDAFTPSVLLDGLDFDTPDSDPPPTASLFSALSLQPDRIEWSNGSVPSAGVLSFSFAVDVPDNLAAVNPAQVNRFTLRQTPIAATPVPEPSTWLLLGSGLLALIPRRHGTWRDSADAEEPASASWLLW